MSLLRRHNIISKIEYNPIVFAQHTGIATEPSGVAVDDVNGKLYVLEKTSGICRKIDIATMTEDDNVTLASSGTTLFLDQPNDRLFATIGAGNSIVEINPTTMSVTTTRTATGVSWAIAMHQGSDGKFYVSDNFGAKAIHVFTDYTLGTSDRVITFGQSAFQMDIDDADVMYVGVPAVTDGVYTIALTSGDTVTKILGTTENVEECRGHYTDVTNGMLITMDASGSALIRIFEKDGLALYKTLTLNSSGGGGIRNIANYVSGRRYFVANTNEDEIAEIRY